MKCSFIKSDNTQCKANAVFNSAFCWYHNPDIPDEVKRAVSSKGGKANSEPQFIESPLPEIKIENMQGLAVLLNDTINNMRTGKISQKSGSAYGYLSFILLLVLEKALKEKEKEKIDKLKAEGKWRPEPKYAPKFYTYKDDFFLDKEGNHLVVEKDGSSFHPCLVFEPEDSSKEETKSLSINKKRDKKHKVKHLINKPLTQEEHEKLMDNPDYNNFSNEMIKSEEINSS